MIDLNKYVLEIRIATKLMIKSDIFINFSQTENYRKNCKLLWSQKRSIWVFWSLTIFEQGKQEVFA